MLVLLLLVSAVAWSALGQNVEASAPWLTVYDEAGRPKWEVQMERLVRTSAGWTGTNVRVTLFLEGSPAVALQAETIAADRYGREWTLSGRVRGEGEGFAMECAQARWAGGLWLEDVEAWGRGVTLRAARVQWRMGQALELSQGSTSFSGWSVEFSSGRYVLAAEELVARDVTVRGHGIELVGQELQAWPRVGKIRVKGAKLVRSA